MDDHHIVGLREDALRGRLNRRQLLQRGAALGLAAPALAGLLAACGSSSSSTSSAGSTSESTSTSSTSSSSVSASAATPAGTGSPSASPAVGNSPEGSASTATIAGAGRGKGGVLKLLWYQAPVIMNPHLASGDKDFDAATPVLEPLGTFDKDGKLQPNLADGVPSLEDGSVSQDGKSVTWKLKKGLKWSDGEPVTSADIKFTYDFATNPDTAATTVASYTDIDTLDVVDEHTVKLNFKQPTPGWATAFVGTNGYIVPQHILKDYVGKKAASAPFNLKPIGTGPYVVTDFAPGDHASYAINDNYREPDKPFFSTVQLKGGGDATSAARAALQTGEVDFAWNLQVQAKVLESLQKSGVGKLVVEELPFAEKLYINVSDPNKTVDGQRSHFGTPHPFQSDLKVRQAYALAVPRQEMSDTLYGPVGKPTANILLGPPQFVSKNTSWKYDLDAAAKLLDEAGWVKGSDGFRAKDGVKMEIVFATSVNSVRQQEQEIVKASFQKLGIKVNLKAIDPAIFFSASPTNDQTFTHFYHDIQMQQRGPENPYPIKFMQDWYGAKNNIAQKENDWNGLNTERWQKDEYDKTFEAAQIELDPSKQAPLFIKMNDLVIDNAVEVPMVHRSTAHGAAKDLENLGLSPWAATLWKIADWVKES